MMGCSGVRISPFDKTYQIELNQNATDVCSPVEAETINLLTDVSFFWRDFYNESQKFLIGSVYLSPAYNEIVAGNVARSAVDADNAQAGRLTQAQMLLLLEKECTALRDIQNALAGKK